MKFKLEIDSGNAGMSTVDDVAEALDQVARRLHCGVLSGRVMDVNGNSVGTFDCSEPEEDGAA